MIRLPSAISLDRYRDHGGQTSAGNVGSAVVSSDLNRALQVTMVAPLNSTGRHLPLVWYRDNIVAISNRRDRLRSRPLQQFPRHLATRCRYCCVNPLPCPSSLHAGPASSSADCRASIVRPPGYSQMTVRRIGVGRSFSYWHLPDRRRARRCCCPQAHRHSHTSARPSCNPCPPSDLPGQRRNQAGGVDRTEGAVPRRHRPRHRLMNSQHVSARSPAGL